MTSTSDGSSEDLKPQEAESVNLFKGPVSFVYTRNSSKFCLRSGCDESATKEVISPDLGASVSLSLSRVHKQLANEHYRILKHLGLCKSENSDPSPELDASVNGSDKFVCLGKDVSKQSVFSGRDAQVDNITEQCVNKEKETSSVDTTPCTSQQSSSLPSLECKVSESAQPSSKLSIQKERVKKLNPQECISTTALNGESKQTNSSREFSLDLLGETFTSKLKETESLNTSESDSTQEPLKTLEQSSKVLESDSEFTGSSSKRVQNAYHGLGNTFGFVSDSNSSEDRAVKKGISSRSLRKMNSSPNCQRAGTTISTSRDGEDDQEHPHSALYKSSTVLNSSSQSDGLNDKSSSQKVNQVVRSNTETENSEKSEKFVSELSSVSHYANPSSDLQTMALALKSVNRKKTNKVEILKAPEPVKPENEEVNFILRGPGTLAQEIASFNYNDLDDNAKEMFDILKEYVAMGFSDSEIIRELVDQDVEKDVLQDMFKFVAVLRMKYGETEEQVFHTLEKRDEKRQVRRMSIKWNPEEISMKSLAAEELKGCGENPATTVATLHSQQLGMCRDIKRRGPIRSNQAVNDVAVETAGGSTIAKESDSYSYELDEVILQRRFKAKKDNSKTVCSYELDGSRKIKRVLNPETALAILEAEEQGVSLLNSPKVIFDYLYPERNREPDPRVRDSHGACQFIPLEDEDLLFPNKTQIMNAYDSSSTAVSSQAPSLVNGRIVTSQEKNAIVPDTYAESSIVLEERIRLMQEFKHGKPRSLFKATRCASVLQDPKTA